MSSFGAKTFHDVKFSFHTANGAYSRKRQALTICILLPYMYSTCTVHKNHFRCKSQWILGGSCHYELLKVYVITSFALPSTTKECKGNLFWLCFCKKNEFNLPSFMLFIEFNHCLHSKFIARCYCRVNEWHDASQWANPFRRLIPIEFAGAVRWILIESDDNMKFNRRFCRLHWTIGVRAKQRIHRAQHLPHLNSLQKGCNWIAISFSFSF